LFTEIRASRILKRTITDFSKHPEHWVQNTFGENGTKEVTDEQMDAWEDRLHVQKSHSPKVREPGDGKYTTFSIYAFDDIIMEPQQYCGLGGIQANAYKLNKKHFWDYKFQTELGVVGAYLNAEAKTRFYVVPAIPANQYWPRSRPVEEYREFFDSFVGFNDHDGRTVEEVIDLFKTVHKQLKVREAKLELRRARAAAKKAAA
jgi:hypothetical protein